MNANQVDGQAVEQLFRVPPALRPPDLDSLWIGNAVAVSRKALIELECSGFRTLRVSIPAELFVPSRSGRMVHR